MKFILKLFCAVLMFTLISCVPTQKTNTEKQINNDSSHEMFGWFSATCFASVNDNLKPDEKILVINLEDPQSVSSATIIGPATTENCGPLAKDRRERNTSEGLYFYQVENKTDFNLAIGIIGKVSLIKTESGKIYADLGDDGTFEQFSFCTTNDGISFDIWSSKPYETPPKWSGFYYLGYDVERNCP